MQMWIKGFGILSEIPTPTTIEYDINLTDKLREIYLKVGRRGMEVGWNHYLMLIGYMREVQNRFSRGATVLGCWDTPPATK